MCSESGGGAQLASSEVIKMSLEDNRMRDNIKKIEEVAHSESRGTDEE